MADVGIKVFFKHLAFGPKKKQGKNWHVYYEAKILRMYALLLIELLLGSRDIYQVESQKLMSAELKAIIMECYRALDKVDKEEKETYEKEIEDFLKQQKGINK